MLAVTSLVESSLGCMKLHYSSGGLGANSGGAHSLRPITPPSSFMGGFFSVFGCVSRSGPLGVINISTERAKAKMGQGME